MHHPRWHPVRIVVLLSISLLFTYLFIRWMYPGLNKLRFDLVRTETALDEIIDYHDLDGDGNSEKIRYISNPDLSSFLVYQGE
ncbi:MAG: hypothetical protein JW861_09490, partial [Bacteroidales bacterium]|nr:hypothetical protein [Bacteroidales bacterium]